MILVISQVLFTFSKLWAKYHLSCEEGFLGCLHIEWLFVYICIHTVATFMQLYVFKTTNILKAMAFFAGVSLLLTISLGYTILNEILDWRDFLSVLLVLSALVLINGEKQKVFSKRK